MSGFGIGVEAGTALSWVKSSYSASYGECLECAAVPGGVVLVRDSKRQAGPVIRSTSAAWRDFLGGVRDGRFGV